MHALRLFALVALVAVPAWASTPTPLLSALRAEAVTSVTAVMRATSASHTGEGTLYFGTKDGGRDPKAWQFTVLIGRHGASDLEAPVEGLEPSTRYFFTFSVKTPDGEEWASSSASP